MKPVTDVRGVGEVLAKALIASGYKSAEDIAKATPAKLVQVSGIGAARAPVLIAAAKEVVATKPAASTQARRAPARKPANRKPATRKPLSRKTATVTAAAKKAEAKRKAEASS